MTRDLVFTGFADDDGSAPAALTAALDQADPAEAIGKIAGHMRRVLPQVVLTFGPEGAYGHPDHIAICQFTTAACVAAADPGYLDTTDLAPHRVSKLYYMTMTQKLGDVYISVFGDLIMNIDGVERTGVANQDWAITTWIDTGAY